MVEVTVEDDGPGMPPASELRQGGLGLASARRVLETSGGDLVIDRSDDLGGARVRLRAQRAEEMPMAASRPDR
jgi:signal transduction histidine kinase